MDLMGFAFINLQFVIINIIIIEEIAIITNFNSFNFIIFNFRKFKLIIVKVNKVIIIFIVIKTLKFFLE